MLSSAVNLNSPAEDHERAWRNAWLRVDLLWTVMLYLCGLGVFSSLLRHPHVPPISVAAAGLLFGVSCFLFHRIYLPGIGAQAMDLPVAAGYFTTQITIIGLLTLLHPGFSLLGWLIIVQVVARLPQQRWLLPLIGIGLVLTGGTWLVYHASPWFWLKALSVLMGIACCAALAWLLLTVIEQRQCLLRLVADLRRVHWEAERSAIEGELLAAMHERTRVARDIHDGIGHILTGLGIKLQTAYHLYDQDRERGLCELRESQELVQEAMQELRHALQSMRAPLHHFDTLPSALQSIVTDVQTRSRIAISLDIPDTVPDLAPRAIETLWRVTREALTNVERHAAAASASVQVALDAHTLTLRIRDDGSGITPNALKRPGHYGIIGMRERIAAYGGTLSVHAPVEGGTCIEARLLLASMR